MLFNAVLWLSFNGSDETVTTAAFTSIATTSLKDPDWSLNTQTYWISLRGEPFKTDLWEFRGETSEMLPYEVSWSAHRSLRARLNMYPDTWAVIQFREDSFHCEIFSTRQNDSVWCNTSRWSNVDIRFQCVCMYFVVLTRDKRKKTRMILKAVIVLLLLLMYRKTDVWTSILDTFTTVPRCFGALVGGEYDNFTNDTILEPMKESKYPRTHVCVWVFEVICQNKAACLTRRVFRLGELPWT